MYSFKILYKANNSEEIYRISTKIYHIYWDHHLKTIRIRTDDWSFRLDNIIRVFDDPDEIIADARRFCQESTIICPKCEQIQQSNLSYRFCRQCGSELKITSVCKYHIQEVKQTPLIQFKPSNNLIVNKNGISFPAFCQDCESWNKDRGCQREKDIAHYRQHAFLSQKPCYGSKCESDNEISRQLCEHFSSEVTPSDKTKFEPSFKHWKQDCRNCKYFGIHPSNTPLCMRRDTIVDYNDYNNDEPSESSKYKGCSHYRLKENTNNE